MDAVTESLPAVFAGAVFLLFGAALLLWTGVRVARREPVAEGARQRTSASMALAAGSGAVALGLWCLSRI